MLNHMWKRLSPEGLLNIAVVCVGTLVVCIRVVSHLPNTSERLVVHIPHNTDTMATN